MWNVAQSKKKICKTEQVDLFSNMIRLSTTDQMWTIFDASNLLRRKIDRNRKRTGQTISFILPLPTLPLFALFSKTARLQNTCKVGTNINEHKNTKKDMHTTALP